MSYRNHRTNRAVRGLIMFAVLVLLLPGWQRVSAGTTAQEQANGGLWSMGIGAVNGVGGAYTYGARFVVTSEDGDYIGECTLLETEFSSTVPWCNCKDDVPRDRNSLVWEDLDSIPAGYAPVENPIVFDPTTYEVGPHNIGAVFLNLPIDENTGSNTGGMSDVAIVTNENGQPAYDACYVLVGFSNEGCDENLDGRVMFSDIPWGVYTVQQTADLGPGRWVDDFTIEVRGNINSSGWEAFAATIVNSSGSGSNTGSISQTGAVDNALISRDPVDGRLLTGTCYVLVDYSNQGCDENGDGQVTFAAIPYGTYTVRQTLTPPGYPTINDYTIAVQPVQGLPGGASGGPLGFIVKQAPEQNAPDTRNISIFMFDSRTGEKVTGLCAEIIGASNVGCDNDLRDGQIDFLDVAAGTYEVRFVDLPAGYVVLTGTRGIPLTIDAGPNAPTIQFLSLLVYVP